MNDSFPIGRLFGIELRVHVLFVYMAVAIVAIGAANGSALTTAAFLGLLVVLVLLHELGHARVAQHFGIQVVDIVLWPLGGMARMTQLPEDPKVEGWVAIAGPLVNLALAGVGALGLLVTVGLQWVNPIAGELVGLQSLLALFVWVNLMLGLFNLVPAFPMDGGRILRALLARKRDWLEATERAVQVSRLVALSMIVGSLVLGFSTGRFLCVLPLIGIYVLWEGTRELWATRMRRAAASGAPFEFGGSPGGGVDLQELFRRAREQRGGPPPPPPRSEDDDASDPGVERPREPGQGFTEEDVRRLEGFRGRLRRRDADADG